MGGKPTTASTSLATSLSSQIRHAIRDSGLFHLFSWDRSVHLLAAQSLQDPNSPFGDIPREIALNVCLQLHAINPIPNFLGRLAGYLLALETYKGNEALIRTALTSPTEANEKLAIEGVCAGVTALHKLYLLGQEIKQIFSSILAEIGRSKSPNELSANISALSALCVFVLEADNFKMKNPSLQNDYSYFRRTRERNQCLTPIPEEDIPIMSHFLAYPTPFFKLALDTQGLDWPQITPVLCSVLDVLVASIDPSIPTKNEFYFLVFVSVLLDHEMERGVFRKKSGFDIIKLIDLIMKFRQEPARRIGADFLRFCSLHLYDPETLSSITKKVALL